MKTMRSILILGSGLVLSARLAAQAPEPVQNVLVTRTYSTHQTDASTVMAGSATPFSFQAAVEGDGSATGSSPISAATVTLPSSTTHGLTFGSGRWKYDSGGYVDASSLKAVFADGDYDMTLTGSGFGTTTISLPDFTASVLNTPLLTLTSTSGSWGGNTYSFVVGESINVDFNSISMGGGDFHYDFSMNGQNTVHDDAHQPNDFVSGESHPPSYIIDTSAFVAGQTYTIEVGYSDIAFQNSNAFGTGYFAAGLYEIRSTITLTALAAIPEPTTYAVIFGGVALTGVMLVRRRQVV